ncbi:MAG: hypothetical protein IKL06_04950, partial [Lachnospiraceae bacterium]|nr:hypothetical protein [Lachnospiraceae bacterium]
MKKGNRSILILANILFGIAILFFAIGFWGKTTEAEADIGRFDTIEFNENWMLTQKDVDSEVLLPTIIPCEKGETLIIRNTLPSYVGAGMRIAIRSSMEETRIYIDNELRDSYLSEDFDYIETHIPSAYILLDLEDEDAGKTIEIQYTVRKEGRLNAISIGYGNNAWFSILYRNLPVTMATIVAIIVGALAILIYFVLRRSIKNAKPILYLGQSMVIIGFWILSESEIRQLIFGKPSYSVYFSYMLIELIAGFIALYFNEVQRHKYNKIYTLVEVLVFGQAGINYLLDLAGIAEFHTTLVFAHAWMALGILVAVVTVLMDLKSKRIKTYAISAWGMLLFLLFCILEIIGFYLKNFYIVGTYMCIG